MEAREEKTLVVETGILCNNRCVFCYQNGYRRVPTMDKLIDADVIRERMEWGIANGYSELSLTGGEPTIRRDFIDLVRHARAIGYAHVAITTNGSRMADAAFFKEAVLAGLDGMGVSIHGASSDVHDSVTGRPGSFINAIKAIRNGARAVQALGGRRFRLNTFTVLHARNVNGLADFTDMLSVLGVRLMILQPPITGKSNVTPLAQVPLDDMVAAVRDAAIAAGRGGYRIKPFNIPPCLFRDVSDGLDLTMYGRVQFRENDSRAPTGHVLGREVGFVRFPACDRCSIADYCSGISLAMVPDVDLAVAFADATGGGEGPVWLSGTELMTATGIRGLLGAMGGRQAWICTGGTHRAGVEMFDVFGETRDGHGIGDDDGQNRADRLDRADRLTHAGRHGIALVHQARDPGSSDRILCGAGNGDWLVDAMDGYRSSGCRAPLAICGACDQGFLELLRRMFDGQQDSVGGSDARVPEIRVAPPWRTSGGTVEALAAIVQWAESTFGNRARVVIGIDWPQGDEIARLRMLAERFATVPGLSIDAAMHVPRTTFENRMYSVLNWSVIPGMRHDREPPDELVVRSFTVDPM